MRVFEAVVTRRLLVNYRLDPGAVAAMLPAPLEPLLRHGAAIGGVSLVRIERLRPRGLVPFGGIALELLVHRVAVSAPNKHGERVAGTCVLRRDVERRLVVALGGRLFGGAHQLSRFEVEEDEGRISVNVRDDQPQPAVTLDAAWGALFRPSPSFATIEEAAGFFVDCEHTFMRAARPGELEAVRLTPQPGRLEGVRMNAVCVRMFEDTSVFPAGAAEFDSALGERRLPLEWIAVREVPETCGNPLLPVPA